MKIKYTKKENKFPFLICNVRELKKCLCILYRLRKYINKITEVQVITLTQTTLNNMLCLIYNSREF